MIEAQQPALEEVVKFIQAHPETDLRVTDSRKEEPGEGRLFAGNEDALQAEFGKGRGANVYLVDRHGGRFLLTEASVVAIKDSVGLEILAAARLIKAETPSDQIEKKPALNQPRPEYDPLSSPLTPQFVAPLMQLLRRFPNTELSVIDLRAPKSHGSAEEGRLCIGRNETLQAEFGPNAFAVQEHPDRFKLTGEGVTAFRQAQSDLEQADLKNADVDEPREYVTAAVGAAQRAEQENLRQDFEKGLEKLISRGEVKNCRDYLTISGLEKSQMQALKRAAADAGFNLQGYNNGSLKNFITVGGDDVSAMLKRILLKQCYGKEMRTLESYDKEGVGAYAIVFDIDSKQLFILNKDLFLHPKT